MSIASETLFLPLAGDLLDDSGNGYDGAWQGGGSPSYATGPAGSANGAVDLDGSHYVELSSPTNLLSLTDGTVSVWLKLDSTTSSSTLFQVNDYSGDYADTPPRNDWRVDYYYGGFTEERNKLNVVRTEDDVLAVVWGNITITDTNWHNVTVVCEAATNTRIFVDGVECSSYSTQTYAHPQGFTSGLNNLDSARIGTFVEDSGAAVVFPLSGNVADVRVFSKALTPGQIAWLATHESLDQPLREMQPRTVRRAARRTLQPTLGA